MISILTNDNCSRCKNIYNVLQKEDVEVELVNISEYIKDIRADKKRSKLLGLSLPFYKINDSYHSYTTLGGGSIYSQIDKLKELNKQND